MQRTESTGVTRTQIINQLGSSPHGDYNYYRPIIAEACKVDPEFVAHLIAWDCTNGQIKDSKAALPILTAASREYPDVLVENSLAHFAMLDPREMLKAFRFAIAQKAPARRQRAIERTIRRYLQFREQEPGRWMRLAMRHRRPLKALYSLTRAPIAEWAGKALFQNQYAPGSILADIANLRNMDATSAAAAIQKWHLSPLVVSGAMAGARATQTDSAIVGATMDQMSDTELVTRAASLEKKGGMKNDATLKEKFRAKVANATKSKKATLKTSVAAEEVEDEGLKTMLRELQERQIQAQKDAGRGVDGNWLVIADRSQSQDHAIQLGMHIAAALAKFVTGRVFLAYCNQEAVAREVTGMSLEDIKGQSQFVIAAGATSYGIGLQWAMEKGFEVDGVAIVGDGGENTTPIFADQHRRYEAKHGKDLPVYLYQTYCAPQFANSPNASPRLFGQHMQQNSRTFTSYDLTHGKIDFYSIPNLVQQMNVSRFGLVERIMSAPLVTLDQVLPMAAAVGR